MTTTLKDVVLGLNKQDAEKIPFFYAFPFKFWFQQHQIAPNDVLSWCRDNATGYYKVASYTYKDSVLLYVANEEQAKKLKHHIEMNPGQSPATVIHWCETHLATPVKVVPFNKGTDALRRRYFEFKVATIYVDKIYLSDETDAAKIKLHFDVSDQQVKRPEKLERKKRKKRKL